jgi:hypothetical protein
MPSVTYGTRDSPGHVALWIISLGTQRDAILQWLGKDKFVKHNTVELAVTYIRSKLMEGRSQTESRQDFDSKLTPIRLGDIRQIQCESYQSTISNNQLGILTQTPTIKDLETSNPDLTYLQSILRSQSMSPTMTLLKSSRTNTMMPMKTLSSPHKLSGSTTDLPTESRHSPSTDRPYS